MRISWRFIFSIFSIVLCRNGSYVIYFSLPVYRIANPIFLQHFGGEVGERLSLNKGLRVQGSFSCPTFHIWYAIVFDNIFIWAFLFQNHPFLCSVVWICLFRLQLWPVVQGFHSCRSCINTFMTKQGFQSLSGWNKW